MSKPWTVAEHLIAQAAEHEARACEPQFQTIDNEHATFRKAHMRAASLLRNEARRLRKRAAR